MSLGYSISDFIDPDACAFWSGRWVQAHWSPKEISQDIGWKELFTIVQAVVRQPYIA